MKNLVKLVGIIAFVAIIGFVFVSCEDPEPKDELDNTRWTKVEGSDTYFISFRSPDFYYGIEGKSSTSGTYTISGDKVTLKSGYNDSEFEGTISGNTMTFTDPSMKGVFTRVK